MRIQQRILARVHDLYAKIKYYQQPIVVNTPPAYRPGSLDVRSFYLLRFARIGPLMLLLLLILSGLHLAHVPDYVVSEKTGGLERTLLAALTFHIGCLEATRDYLPGNWDILWSLSVEEMFYHFFL